MWQQCWKTDYERKSSSYLSVCELIYFKSKYSDPPISFLITPVVIGVSRKIERFCIQYISHKFFSQKMQGSTAQKIHVWIINKSHFFTSKKHKCTKKQGTIF